MCKNNNIETINLAPKKGVIDLEYFDNMIDEFNFKLEVCNMTKEYVKEAVKDAVERADLEHVDFELHETTDFEEGLMEEDTRLNGVILAGEDDEYAYFLSVLMGYDDELDDDEDYDDLQVDSYEDMEALLDDDEDDEDEEDYDIEDIIEAPDSICVCLVRSRKDEKTDCSQYDYEQGKWIDLDYEEFTGLTEDQVSIISSDDDPVKSGILMSYRHEYGDISDKDFEKFCNKNKEIIELARASERFMEVMLYDDDTLVLTTNSNYDGAIVTYENGNYNLYSSFICEPLKCVFKTSDADKMLIILADVFDKSFYNDTVAVVPLSDSAFSVFRASGRIELFFAYKEGCPKRDKMTEQEEAVVDEYINKINSFHE